MDYKGKPAVTPFKDSIYESEIERLQAKVVELEGELEIIRKQYHNILGKYHKWEAAEQQVKELREALLEAADHIDYLTKDRQGVTDGSDWRDIAQQTTANTNQGET